MSLIKLIKDDSKMQGNKILPHLDLSKTNEEIIESMKINSLLNFDNNENQETK